MTSKGGHESGALARAIGAVVEGLTFYDLANAAVAEVRVKVAFEELGRRKRAQLARLEAVTGRTAKDAAVLPGIFPMDAVSKPNQCPNCGAARYAFEKEIALTKAWEIARDSGRKSAALFREAASKAERPAQAVFEELARDEESEVAQADRQLAELRT